MEEPLPEPIEPLPRVPPEAIPEPDVPEPEPDPEEVVPAPGLMVNPPVPLDIPEPDMDEVPGPGFDMDPPVAARVPEPTPGRDDIPPELPGPDGDVIVSVPIGAVSRPRVVEPPISGDAERDRLAEMVVGLLTAAWRALSAPPAIGAVTSTAATRPAAIFVPRVHVWGCSSTGAAC